MRKPDRELLTFWEQTSHLYRQQMGEECLSYLNGRGISTGTAVSCHLGYVADPAPGHEAMRGRLAIPYFKRLAVVGLKFRCIQDHSCKDAGHAKYLSDGGQWLYGTDALLLPSDQIAICEGELDTIIMRKEVGLPAVGVPGVEAWKGHPWWADLFQGHRYVAVMTDNDSRNGNPGQRLASAIQADIPRARITPPPVDMDVTDTFLEYGADDLRKRSGMTVDIR